MPTSEIKLVDVAEMGYTSEDIDEHGCITPRGEICFRGFNCFKGYFAMPKETRETIDEEGWVHSGDIGLLTTQGCLKIIDRKKNIFKLSQAEYVIPDKIENLLVKCQYLSQIFIYGDSLQNYLTAIIVPDKLQLENWAKENALDSFALEDFLNHQMIH